MAVVAAEVLEMLLENPVVAPVVVREAQVAGVVKQYTAFAG